MNCPNCHQENPASSRFCQYCGANMSTTVKTDVPQAVSLPPPGLNPKREKYGVKPDVPQTVSLPYWSTDVEGAGPGVKTDVLPGDSAYGQIGQVGAGGTTTLNIWGPFAGHGTRGRHASWLLDDLGEKAEALHQAVTERFTQRQVPGSHMNWVTLVAKGLLVERRPFYFIRRGITTVALYIARFGQDLYISQVTYVKGPISNVRVAILGLMLLFYLYYVTAYGSALVGSLNSFNPFSSNASGFPFFLLCVIGPLGALNSFALFLALIFSVYKWLREKDFLAIARTPPNEFEEDDTVALEKAVEETVRQSLDAIGVDPKLMPPAPEYGLRQRLI